MHARLLVWVHVPPVLPAISRTFPPVRSGWSVTTGPSTKPITISGLPLVRSINGVRLTKSKTSLAVVSRWESGGRFSSPLHCFADVNIGRATCFVISFPRAEILSQKSSLRACLKIAWGPAARDFGCGQGGEARASPQRAVRAEPTQAAGKRPAARRVFAQKAVWLRCSSVADRCGYPGPCGSIAPCHTAFSAKTGPHGIFRQALRRHCS